MPPAKASPACATCATLAAADVHRHIGGGKQCTRLVMTWADRMSLVLTKSLAMKRIAALDVFKETGGTTTKDDERFDTDFALMTVERAKMLAAPG
jgi:recombination associated protein RdgC